MKQTPLHEIHVSLGATLTDFAGWSMPLRYASEIAEHHTVRNAAGLFDLCHMGEIEVTGPDAAATLDYALIGRASKIGVGRARYSMICDNSGGILDDLVVYRLGADRFLIVANASNTSEVVSRLSERADGSDTLIRDTTLDWALIAVQGPASAAIIDGLISLTVEDLKYYSIDEGVLAGFPVLVARTGYTGEDGFEIYCSPADARGVWTAVATAGAPYRLVPAGLASRDTLRLEAGMPLYGQELSTSVSPFEAGLGRVVSFEKPDGFVGQDALLVRQAAPPRESLVGLRGTGRRSPRAGYAVLDPETQEPRGRVTSGALSPTLGYPIAMAYVREGLNTPGTRLLVDVRGSHDVVEVIALPFYKRPS